MVLDRAVRFQVRLVAVLAMAAALLIGFGLNAVGADDAASNVTDDCVNGWSAPAPGTERFEEAVQLILGQMGIQGVLEVEEMRYFTGPENDWVIPHDGAVERWYVVGRLAGDPNFRGRWLVESRSEDVRGISAVASYASTGYASPDWRAFVGDGELRIVDGLPGEWAGLEYDFVTGEGDSGNPGLPDEVAGCLAATGAALPVTR